MSQRPVAIGLLLCEQLIIEEGTKNVTPVNCFTQRSAAFPVDLAAIRCGGLAHGQLRLR